MERKKASDFPQELLDEFHLYVHGDIDRRTFLDRAGKYAVGGLTAAAILDMLKPNYAWAEQVPKDDKRIKAEYATWFDRRKRARRPRFRRSLSCTRTAGSIRTSKMWPVVSAPTTSWRSRPTA